MVTGSDAGALPPLVDWSSPLRTLALSLRGAAFLHPQRKLIKCPAARALTPRL